MAKMEMDPWTSCHSHVTVTVLENNTVLTKFEDNFIPDPGLHDKLPDHEQYLEILESKLRKLKSDHNVLRQLAAKKESYMQQLLSEQPECNLVQLSLEEPISDSSLLRALLPQRQALNQGEVVEFIKYDQLIEDDGGDNAVNVHQVANLEKLENHTSSV